MSDQRGFAVDPQAVHAFGTGLRHDLDVHLSSEKVQTLHVFSQTPGFGTRALSEDVRQAARNYHARLVELYDVMDALLYNGAALARAAHTIADAYAESDTLAGTDIQRSLADARPAVTADASATDPDTGRPI